MINKQVKRQRRAKRARAKIIELNRIRLCVYRSANHIYAQVISPTDSKVLATASSLEKSLRTQFKHCGNREVATAVGKLIAERAQKIGIKQIAFDRNGYKFHGRVKALADAARQTGLDF